MCIRDRPVEEVIQAVTSQSFQVASDGGAAEGNASFGWSIADHRGKTLVECAGPGYGFNPSSYRAESYGVLAPARFLLHMKMYFNTNPLKDFTHYCDNIRVVKSVTASMAYEGYYPNDTLKAEWDVLQQVKECYTEMGCKQTLLHVKGHQDKDKPYAELTRPAQLNVDCDHLAGDFLDSTMYANRVHVPMLPCAKVQINLNQGTITNKIKTEARIARTKQPLVDKLLKDNSWEESTFELVDWKSHGRAIQRHNSHRTTITKMLYDILPVGKMVHKYSKSYLESCSSCDAELEDMAHLLQCPDEK